jgi:hypothetical protein
MATQYTRSELSLHLSKLVVVYECASILHMCVYARVCREGDCPSVFDVGVLTQHACGSQCLCAGLLLSNQCMSSI